MINRSKNRIKQTGEIFTPLPLVDEMLTKLPQETWKPKKTFIDASVGDGNFLVRVVAWKIWKGSTAKQALETTYGVDIMEDNVSHARSRILTNAFYAQHWKKNNDTLIQHLTHEDEREISLMKGHDQFAKKYNNTVVKNIVCHDALTYDYSFGEPTEETQRLKRLGIELS